LETKHSGKLMQAQTLARKKYASSENEAVLTPEETRAISQALAVQQVQVVYRQALPAMVISIMVAALLCGILWENTEHVRLYAWFAAIVLVALWRSVIVFSYRRAIPVEADVLRWERAFVVSLGVSALVWGVGGLLVMPHDSLLHQNGGVFLFDWDEQRLCTDVRRAHVGDCIYLDGDHDADDYLVFVSGRPDPAGAGVWWLHLSRLDAAQYPRAGRFFAAQFSAGV